MTRMNHHSRELISDRIDKHLNSFEATPIHDRIYDADNGDDLVTELAEAAGRTYYAVKEVSGSSRDRDYDDPVRRPTRAGYNELCDALHLRVDELVAQACGNALEHADEWPDRYDEEEIGQSKQEARDWLEQHKDIAERVGVLDTIEE
jgi:hypothetical protein